MSSLHQAKAQGIPVRHHAVATFQFRQRYFTDLRLSVVENSNNPWFFLLNHTNGKRHGFDAIEAQYIKNYRSFTTRAIQLHG